MKEDPFLAEILKIENDALYTSQTNFIQASFYDRVNFWLGIPATIAGALAVAAIITEWSTTAGGVLALVATILVAVQTFVTPERRAVEHNQQGVGYRQLQADARVFRTIDYDTMDQNARRMKLAELVQRRVELNARNRPNERAFKKAQAKVASGDVTYGEKPPLTATDTPPTDS
jgi:hypothetical protein